MERSFRIIARIETIFLVEEQTASRPGFVRSSHTSISIKCEKKLICPEWGPGEGVLTPADPPLAMGGFHAGVTCLVTNSLGAELPPHLDGSTGATLVLSRSALTHLPMKGRRPYRRAKVQKRQEFLN
jgi:hypothetical protein